MNHKRNKKKNNSIPFPYKVIAILMAFCMLAGVLTNMSIPSLASTSANGGEEEETLDSSVTAGAVAAEDGNGNPVTETLTGDWLTATLYTYNDNPNAAATATLRFYVIQTSGTAEVTLSDESITEAEGAGWSWHVPGETSDPDDATVTNAGSDPDSAYPYFEVEVEAGRTVAAEALFSCATGYDSVVSAYIYIEADTMDNDGTYDTVCLSETDPLTLTWTGSCGWDAFAKEADLSAIGMEDGEIKADEVNYSFSAENLTSGNTGIIYTDHVTLSDSLVLPVGLPLPDGAYASICDPQGSDGMAAAVLDKDGGVIYALYYTGSYEYTVDSFEITENEDGTTGISYSITVENPDLEDVSFNPVGDISASLSFACLQDTADVSLLVDAQIANTASFCAYSAAEGNPVIYEGTDDALVLFDETMSYTISKSVYSVKDGLGKVTYGYGLDPMTPSDEKVSDTGIPYVAQGYTVTYRVDVGSTYSTNTTVTVTDLIQSGITFDESSVSVQNGTKVSVSTEEDTQTGGTLVTFEIKVSAGKTASIYYGVVIGDAGTVADTAITNVATVGDKSSQATIMTPPRTGF